jgi:MafB19-like deaminase
MRHDAHRWMQPDAARWLPPGTDPADVYPALAPKRDAAKAAAFAAEIAQAQRVLDALREEVASIRADMARRRALAIKYSPAQPRVPAGNPRGGQWSNGNAGGTGFGSFGGFGSADGEGSAEGTDGTEDAGSSDSSESGGTSGDPTSSDKPEGDGTRGYDDRLAASDKPSPGRAALLGIMARAAARVIEAYRSENLLFDLFGNKGGAVAVTTIDDKDIFGSNSTSATYTDADRRAATDLRDKLVAKYPDVMSIDNLGDAPNNALFHAETNVLLRAAQANNGTLAGRSLDIYVDRRFCGNCQVAIPLVGLELGNPTLTYVDPDRIYSIANGKITFRSKR